MESFNNHFTHRIAVKRESETESERDNESTHENKRVKSRIAVQYIRSLG